MARTDNLNTDVTLDDSPPSDGISDIDFSDDNLLAVSSWDHTVSIYKVEQNGQCEFRYKFRHNLPVLSCNFSKDGAMVASAGSDNIVKIYDVVSGNEASIAAHEKPVQSVRFIDSYNGPILVSGSWDKKIKFWDLRQQRLAQELDCGERVYTMDVQQNLLIVGTANKDVKIIDFNHPFQPPKEFKSSLQHQIKVVKLFPDLKGFAVGGIEGRCAIQYFDNPGADYSFKCHRAPAPRNKTYVYAVNDLCFHPNRDYGTFGTAGSDGGIHFWDKNQKRKLQPLIDKGSSVTAIKFNRTGSLFAYAIGYDWSKGHQRNTPEYPTGIKLHVVEDYECKPLRK